MDQKKINYLIIGAVVIFLLILGVYYYQNIKISTQTEQTSITTPTPPPQGGEKSSPPSEGGVLAPSEGGGNPKLSTAEIKAKFNTAMDNARTAFRNKDYPQAIIYYKQALTYQKVDTPYSGLFVVYGAQKEWAKALEALDSALKINPLFVDYWKSKIEVLSEQTSASFQDLKNVYNEGLLKVDPARKIDLITFFAQIAENIGQKDEAINLWGYAKEVYPDNALIYQAEIERLQN